MMASRINYRKMAKGHVNAARTELAASPSRARYAVLELRMAIEALCYERAQAYKAELPKSTYRVWQPRKLMDFLLALDPLADQRRSFSYAKNDDTGQPVGPTKTLGTDTPLKLSEIKKHYDALGNYLHVPTLAQMEDSTNADMVKLQARCAKILSVLEGVVSSKVFNVIFGQFATLKCTRCSGIMKVRVDERNADFCYACIHCSAQYKVRKVDAEKWRFEPDLVEITCTHVDCKGKLSFWRDEISVGNTLECNQCGKASEIKLCLSAVTTTS
jgi:hypothetical protein